MAHHGEPMDIDSVDGDFDNKENTFHHSNVLPCTEKGYEELDVSELNMKLRYSITPASSPMSKSYTACLDSRNLDSDDSLNLIHENGNLTHSLNSTLTNNDSVIKALKSLPLQLIPTEQFVDSNRNASVLRQLDTTLDTDSNNVTVTISGTNDIDDNLSLPSSSSSIVHTPEATTPTKNTSKSDGGSPIIRGLKTVLNMFRSSQSPIPPVDGDNNTKQQALCSTDNVSSNGENRHSKPQAVASTPVAAHRSKDGNTSKRNSPYKDSIVFNDDLEKELQWTDETTIIFSQEKIPIHKLFFQTAKPESKNIENPVNEIQKQLAINLNNTAADMDISFNDSNIGDKTMNEMQTGVMNRSEQNVATESDSEFLDCETTFTKNESQMLVEPTDESTILKIDDIPKLNLTKDSLPIITMENLSMTKEILTSKTSHETSEANSSLNSDNRVANATGTIQKTFDDKELENNIEANVVLPEFTAFLKSEQLPITNDAKDDKHISEEMSIAEEKTEIYLEITSQKDKPEPEEENLGMKQTFVNVATESEIESQILNQNNEVDEVLAIEPKLETLLNNEASDIKIIDIQEPSSLSNGDDNSFMAPEIDILEDGVNRTVVHVNNSANSVTLCETLNHKIKPQNPLICASIEQTVKEPSHDPDKNSEQITLNVVPRELPANIPLPLEDDIEIEVIIPADALVQNNIQGMHTNIQDDINAKITLDNTELALKNNIINNDDFMPEMLLSSNILTENTDSTRFQDNALRAGHEIIESYNVLEPAELRGVDNKFEEIHNEIQEVQFTNIKKSLDELQLLPDLINQTMTSITLENVERGADISLECAEQAQYIITNLENIKQHTFVPNIPEIVPVSVDKEINDDMFEPKNFENKNNISQLFLNNDVIEQDNKSVTEIIQNTEISAPAYNEEKSIIVPEANQANYLIKQIEIKKKENRLEVIPNEIEKQEVTITHDNFLVPGNNNPYVSVMDNMEQVAETKYAENTEEIENTFIKHTVVPSSPPITSKGYNFNFDEIDDPFASKTKIRMSPTPETPGEYIETITDKNMKKIDIPKKEINKNRRRSQPERKKPTISRKKFNSTFDAVSSVETPIKKQTNVSQVVKEDIGSNSSEPLHDEISASSNIGNQEKCNDFTEKCNNIFSEHVPTILEVVDSQIQVDVVTTSSEKNLEKHTEVNVENISSIESMTATNEIKTMSSLEQSTYYSAGASSNESIISRNVFNLPEIEDMNFNPFATKSKMRQSPPPILEIQDPFATKSKIQCSPDSSMNEMANAECQNSSTAFDEKQQFTSFDKNSEDKMETEPMEKDSSNTSNTTCSSKATDNKNVTVREVNTEDEDTIEGPFLEAEDHNVDKMSDIDSENLDMMQFTDLPLQENEENLEGRELFIDAEAFEFLLNQNKSNVVADSGKESLFLKFDPLFAKRISSDGVLTALNAIQKRQSTPIKADKHPQKSNTSMPGPSTLNITYEGDSNRPQDSHEDLNITVSKPTMVVTPAVNPVAAPRNKSLTPTRSNRRSITFTSPAMAVIDRLLSLSANNSLVGHDATMTHVSREQNDADIALTQLRELLAEKDIHVYNLRSESKELKDRLATLESQMRILETDSQERLKKINELNDRLVEKTKINKSMAAVVEEYERTIASLISETEQDKKRNAEERIRLINERDEQAAHLASMEVSFSDLHSKYEKSKQVILSCKANEDTYKKSIQEFQETLAKMQSNYELLKQHATSKLNHANQELEKMNRAHEAEVLKLNAMVKRKELHITSLEETLTQKTKANEELTAICDELINKVG